MNSKKVELLPCPFCGSTNIELIEGSWENPNGYEWGGGKYYKVKCLDCFCGTKEHRCGFSNSDKTKEKEEAIKTWNKRYSIKRPRSYEKTGFSSIDDFDKIEANVVDCPKCFYKIPVMKQYIDYETLYNEAIKQINYLKTKELSE